MNPKQRAAEAALQFVKSGMVVGLGTGSTADFFLIALGEAINAGKLHDIRGVPTSVRSEQRARELGIPLADFSAGVRPAVTIDGADEVAGNLDLIKGLGGALLREKVVAQNSDQLIIIADAGKRVNKLGSHVALPIEVTKFGHELQPAYFESLGGRPTLRHAANGQAFVTDNGNYIYDCKFAGIDRPAELENQLKRRAGVVETGLFIGIARKAVIGSESDVAVIG